MAGIGPIISLSLPKSGTTTFATALRHAGLRVADWRIRPGDTDNAKLHRNLIAPLMYHDYFAHGDPLLRLSEFDALTEINAVNHKMSLWPQTDLALLGAIEAHHPNVRFVLSARRAEDVARSMMRWNNLGRERLPKSDVPGMPRGFGRTPEELMRWIEGHYAACARAFAGRSHFLAYRPDDLQVQGKLSDFLGLELPWWGKSNATEDTQMSDQSAASGQEP